MSSAPPPPNVPLAPSLEPTSKPSLWHAPWVNLVSRLGALVLVFAFFSALVANGKFYTLNNIEDMLRQSCVYATAAMGMTIIIVGAGIDLSAGSMIALCVMSVAWVLNLGYPVPVPHSTQTVMHYYLSDYPTLLPIAALLAGVLAGVVAGLINGLIVVFLRLGPFIVTLGTMLIFRGMAYRIGNQKSLYPPQTWLSKILDPTLVHWLHWFEGAPHAQAPKGLGWLILPLGVWIMLVSMLVAGFVLRYTRFGRHVFAIGSNEETARLCGVPVGRTKIIIYALGGFFFGLAALMQFSYISGVGFPGTAVTYELYAIAAVIIGGASFNGGEGSVFGSLIGALIITILYAGGQSMGWKMCDQQIAIGAILILAVALDQIRNRRLA